MFDDFMLRALLAGLGVAALTAPLGCFVVWQRMAMFGNTIAHSGLLGVGLGILLSIDLTVGVIAVALAIALLLAALQRQRLLPEDSLLGILAHGSLAAGMILANLAGGARLDLMGYLFGDILAVSHRDLIWIAGGLAGMVLSMVWLWRPLLAVSVHAELAAAEGVNVGRVRVAFMLLIALTVALALKIVGILLITSLLIIPAAAARAFAATPEQMAAGAGGVAALSVILGLALSLRLDIPAGPAIVVVLTALFAVSALFLFRLGRG